MVEYAEVDDQQILHLFQDAIVELDKIEEDSNAQKRKVVQQLAKDLEGNIPIETIAMEIVKQLEGRVSGRFVRVCLDEKYKQEYRVKNARKQKDGLAALQPLNSDNIDQNKTEILINTSGNVVTESPPDNIDHDIQPDSVTEIAYTDKKCLQCAKYEIRVGELEEALSKASPLTQADKIIGENGSTSDVSSEDDVLDFEIRLDWETVQKHMAKRYAAGRCLEVWLSGKLDRNTGKIISIQVGRRTERKTFAGEEGMT